jgi:hypothetical protein
MTPRKTIAILLAFIVLASAGVWLKRYFDIDRCLDDGGRWNYDASRCETS